METRPTGQRGNPQWGRLLGRTGERLSAVGFGCMGLVGWYGSRNDAEARATLLEATDRGMSHLDTAASYQNGENEKFVGSLIRDRSGAVFLAQGVFVIPGMKTRAHLNDNIDALNVTLSGAEQKELNAEIEAITVRGDRHAPAMMKVLDG